MSRIVINFPINLGICRSYICTWYNHFSHLIIFIFWPMEAPALRCQVSIFIYVVVSEEREADWCLNHAKSGRAQYLKRAAMQPRTITAPKSDRFCLQVGRTYHTGWQFLHQHCRCFSGGLVSVGPFFYTCYSVPDIRMFSVMWEHPWSEIPVLVSESSKVFCSIKGTWACLRLWKGANC